METQVNAIANVSPTVDQEGLSSHSLLLRPASDINDIVRSWATYQELKTRLLDSSDWQNISGRKCIKKSGWRKLQTAFAISDELIKEERKDYENFFVFEVTVKAAASNGRYSFGLGSCASNERRFTHPEHDTRSTAHTRAKNRAISDLIGGGEVSAEEMVTSDERGRDVSYASNYEQKKQIETIVGPQATEQKNEQSFDSMLTEKQRSYLINLINSRISDEEEREQRLVEMENLNRKEASEWIQQMCSM